MPVSGRERASHGRIYSIAEKDTCLDTVQLNRLEQSFRQWAQEALRPDVKLSRRRILLIFFLIRYTGGKLNEVLALDPFRDIDYDQHLIVFGKAPKGTRKNGREVRISENLSREIHLLMADPEFRDFLGHKLAIDAGFVRRKFYERAEACGFPKRLGAPEMIRKSRALELMQSNMPLPAVQMMLGHSTPNLTTSGLVFSDDDIREVAKFFIEKESARKTSARNTFWGKIRRIRRGDVQAEVQLMTFGGYVLLTLITDESVRRLGLKEGTLIAAEIKAPWVVLQKNDTEPLTTAENRFCGTIERIVRGKIITEFVVRISDDTQICSVVTSESARHLALREKDSVWVLFNGFSVVLHTE